MPRAIRSLVLAALLATGLATASAWAQPDAATGAPQPDITSQRQDGYTLQEYRIDGRLYAIRVVSDDAPAYFLLDTNGDGNFQRIDAESVPVPDWASRG